MESINRMKIIFCCTADNVLPFVYHDSLFFQQSPLCFDKFNIFLAS